MADQFNRSASKEELIELFVAVIRGAEGPGALQANNPFNKELNVPAALLAVLLANGRAAIKRCFP